MSQSDVADIATNGQETTARGLWVSKRVGFEMLRGPH